MKKIKGKIADAIFFAYAVLIVFAVWVIELVCPKSIFENE